MSKVFKGDLGTKLVVDTDVDISLATVLKIYYIKPDGTKGSWTGTLEGTDSISYTTTSVSDLGQVGLWILQAYVEMSGGKWYGEAVALNIYDVLSAGQSYLTNLASIRRFLEIASDDVSDDAIFNELVIKASKFIENYCGRVFLSATYTEYYQGNGSSELMLKNYPVTAITSCYDDPDRVWGASTEVPVADLQISDRVPGLIIYDDGTFYDARTNTRFPVENVKITYVAGYAVVPQDIELAANLLCAYYYISQKSNTNAPVGGKDPEKKQEEALKILDNYKRVR